MISGLRIKPGVTGSMPLDMGFWIPGQVRNDLWPGFTTFAPQMKYRKLKNPELGRIDAEAYKAQPKTPIVVVLDNIRSLNNIGSVFRSADAFAIQKVYLCGITAKPPHKDIQKTALGATDSVDWEYLENVDQLIAALKEQGLQIAAVEQAEDSTSLAAFQPQAGKTYAVVFGNEVKGVRQSVVSASDVVLEIPQYGTKHSLNISVSVGVVLWDLFCKLR